MDRNPVRFAREAAGLHALRRQGENDFAARANELSAFIRDRGALPTVGSHDQAEAALGSWLEGQRAADRRGRLSAQRALVLQGILGARWSSPGP